MKCCFDSAAYLLQMISLCFFMCLTLNRLIDPCWCVWEQMCCVGRLAYWLQSVSGALICSASEHYKTLVIYRGHENKLFRCTSFYIDIGSTADELQTLWLWDTSNIYSHYIFYIYLVTFLADYVKCLVISSVKQQDGVTMNERGCWLFTADI